MRGIAVEDEILRRVVQTHATLRAPQQSGREAIDDRDDVQHQDFLPMTTIAPIAAGVAEALHGERGAPRRSRGHASTGRRHCDAALFNR